jgi:hypothetical protein
MDLNGYVDRIEHSVGDPAALDGLRQEIAADSSVSDGDRAFFDERIGTYLADFDRAAGPHDTDTVPDEIQ